MQLALLLVREPPPLLQLEPAKQLQDCRGADSWNNSIDYSIFPIELWNDQIVAAMPDLCQKPLCNKDGKEISSICPHIRRQGGRSGPQRLLLPYSKRPLGWAAGAATTAAKVGAVAEAAAARAAARPAT